MKTKLDAQVRGLIKRLQAQVPVNITGIAAVLGIKVWESKSLPEGIAGKITRNDPYGGSTGFSIVVRAQDPLVRKRFTVAHEIAHYLLHRYLIRKELVDNTLYRSGLSTPMEAQANALAAELLMPDHLLAGSAGKEISTLASEFQVSDRAMEIRLQSLADSVSAATPDVTPDQIEKLLQQA